MQATCKPPIVKTLAKPVAHVKAYRSRESLQVQEPRANARRLIDSMAGIIHQPERVSVRLSAN